MKIAMIDETVYIKFSDGGYRESQSIEVILLFSIYKKLEEIRCGLIDLEKEKP